MTERLRVLIVDDHDAVRRGVRSLLSTRSTWSICGEAADGLEAVEMAKALKPEIVIMDISMPRMDGLEASRIIGREVPESKIIIISQNDPAIVRAQAAQVNASACVAKADLVRELLPAVEAIMAVDRGRVTRSGASPQSQSPAREDWLFGGGILGQLIRDYDWSRTPLGPIESWPQSLRTSVNLMLNSQHPMWIGWGPEMTFLYNDAYISVLSLAKHPKSLGRPASVVWAEIWDVCGPLADRVFSKGEPTFLHDVRLFMNRGDCLEETYYSFSYSAIHGESGGVAGLFCPSTETTAKVLNGRRLRTLSELSAKALIEKSTQAACASSLATLAANPDDTPFALLYLLDAGGKVAKLEGTSRVPRDAEQISPSEIPLESGAPEAGLWPIGEVIASSQSKLISVKGVTQLPLGAASQPMSEAIALPVTSLGQERPIGVLVAGINPTRKLDAEYRTFFVLVADQLATAVQNARASEEEKKRSETLAEVDRAKTVFFSNVSHEFRTPLTLMLGPLEDMLAKPDEEVYPANRELLKVIHRSCLRLQKLVNTLLDFARIEAGRTQANYEPTDLAALTTDIASAFRSTIERAGMKLIVDCAPQGEQVYVDREMWEKIVMNLLSNAFKFTFEGEIQVRLRQVDGRAELSVRDTGIGIAAAELPYIFERFHRVKNVRGRSFEGSGIGLALVQELVQLHKGELSAASAPNQGSTFTVSVPMGFAHIPAERLGAGRSQWFTVVQAHSYIEEALRWLPDGDAGSCRTKGPDPGSAEVSGQSAAPGSSGARPRILLADDNADLRNYVGRLLSFGYDVEAVPDGEAALESALQNPPSLVLADIMMPKLDGFGLLKALRADQRTATIPTILLSARAGEESRLEGIGAGADDYLVKPFSSRELVIRVETHLHLSRLRREAENRFRTLAESLDAEVRLRTKELEERNAYVLRQSEQMRNLSQRLMQIQDAERRHIARELHDSAGQTLAALGMSLGSLGHLAKESDPKLAEQAEDSQQLVQQLSQEIRTMSYLLHPPLLDETGLSAALSWYVRGLSERSGLNVNLDIPDDFGRLPRDMELMIFRVVQECLTNIHRHSGSRVAHIRIARANRSVVVEIRDEGKGMAAEKLAEIQSQGSGVGIRGMRERVYQFQGDITMESDGNGTRIVAKVPITVSEAPGPNVAPLHATG